MQSAIEKRKLSREGSFHIPQFNAAIRSVARVPFESDKIDPLLADDVFAEIFGEIAKEDVWRTVGEDDDQSSFTGSFTSAVDFTPPRLKEPDDFDDTTHMPKRIMTDVDVKHVEKCEDPISCRECVIMSQQFRHDPDWCLASRVASRPDTVIDGRRYFAIENTFHDKMVKLNIDYEFEDLDDIQQTDRVAAVPSAMDSGRALDMLHKNLRPTLMTVNLVLRSWPETPPDFELYKQASDRIKRARLKINSMSRDKKQLVLAIVVYREAAQMFNAFIQRVRLKKEETRLAAKGEHDYVARFDPLPRTTWINDETQGLQMIGTGMSFRDIMNLRVILFSNDKASIAKAKIELAALRDVQEVRAVQAKPLYTFEHWLLRAGLSPHEVAALFYEYDENGQRYEKRLPVCIVCTQEVKSSHGHYEHTGRCPVSKYLSMRWNYTGQPRSASTIGDFMRRVLKMRRKQIVLEKTQGGSRILTYDTDRKQISSTTRRDVVDREERGRIPVAQTRRTPPQSPQPVRQRMPSTGRFQVPQLRMDGAGYGGVPRRGH